MMDLLDQKVIGYEATKDILRQILDILSHRRAYEARGAAIPHGLLMVSEPGLGKSLMAGAFMEESKRNCTVFHKNSDGESFLDALRDTFLLARESAPSVLLLEDINLYADSPSPYGPQWAALQSGIDDARDADVFVIATANTTSCVPQSLLRPGRFDYLIHLEPPKGENAERIAAYYLKDKPLGDDVVISDIVRAMGNHTSCATLETVMNVASINSCYRGAEKISKADLADAILQTAYHLKKDDGEKNPDIEQIALHEAAHAVVADVLKPGSVSLVTLRKNGRTQGMTQYYCDKEISTEADFLNLAIKSLAGKAGVEMVFCKFDMGATEDIQTAAGYVRQWIESFGGSGFSGIICDQHAASETILAQNEKLAAAKLEELYRTAQTILHNNHNFLLAVQKELLKQETLFGSDIAVIRCASGEETRYMAFRNKAHIGVGQDGGLVHSVEVTGANTHNITMVPELLTGEENTVYGCSGYLGTEKRNNAIMRDTKGEKDQVENQPETIKNHEEMYDSCGERAIMTLI